LTNARRKTMAAFDPATLDRWRALAIVDRDGTTVGTISEFYLDRATGHPTWALVNTGLFGATQTFVPLVHATEISDGLQVPYQKNHIKDAPKVDLHDELSPQEEAELFAHYGVDYHPSPEAVPGPVPTDDAGEVPGSTADAVAEPGSAEDAVTDPGSTADAVAEPGSAEAVVADAGSAGDAGAATAPTGEGPGPVPAEPGWTDPAESADIQSARLTSETAPAGPGPDDATSAQLDTTPEAGSPVPDEPGTTEAPPPEPPSSGSHQIDLEERSDGGSGIDHDEGPSDPSQSTPPDLKDHPDRSGATSANVEDNRPTATSPGLEDADRSTATSVPSDPDLSRTAPVEPGLPGSTATSPYGSGPPTIDKADPPEASDAPPGEAGWPPGQAGSFEEHEPFDQPSGASDRWREAKLAAERDRIARTAAAQPEERSPLERARRRLERLVGVGQEHPDEISAADRDAAERARRARLGLDEDDHPR
jgi:hypothetical protein